MISTFLTSRQAERAMTSSRSISADVLLACSPATGYRSFPTTRSPVPSFERGGCAAAQL